jgi:hypothetical protein
MLSDIDERYNIPDIPFKLIKKLIKTPKKSVCEFLRSC